MEEKIKVTTYWDGKIYVGISLTWDHEICMVQLAMSWYVHAALHYFQHEPPYPWTPARYGNTDQILRDKHPSDVLYTSNKKRLEKIVGKFLYYARSIDSTMVMALNSLVAVQTKSTVEVEKNITHFLNYCASNPDDVTEYKRNYIILHLYSDASCLSEPEALSRSGGYFFLVPRPKNKTPISEVPQ